MGEVARTGLACRRCNKPSAIQRNGAVVTGLPVRERTPGDKIYCGECLKEIAREIESVCDKCQQLEMNIAQIADRTVGR